MSQLPSQALSVTAEIRDFFAHAVARWPLWQSGAIHRLASMATRKAKSGNHMLREQEPLREVVLLAFCDPPPDAYLGLQGLSQKEWKRLLHWLDVSGLALYFLDRMGELQQRDRLPRSVLARLQQNLRDNRVRTQGMIAESVAIQQEFQKAYLSYATLKGFSLSPASVPKPELRHQFDLDFLVAEKSVSDARTILERRGYRLYAISGRSWEFKKNETPGISVQDLYKDLPGRAVELHIEADIPGRSSLLERIERWEFYGISMPVLSPVDLLLGQGMHAYKHIHSEFSRTAHLLEFRRHVLFRREDGTFWAELQSRGEKDPWVCLGLGVVTLLITHVMGDFAPEGLTRWTVGSLPQSAQLWVKRYGRRIAFGSFPGNKLYLLLQKELESAGVRPNRSLRQALLPGNLPPLLIRAATDENLRVRIRRYRMQLHFLLLRLRFHVVEGLRYNWESYRWRRYTERHTR